MERKVDGGVVVRPHPNNGRPHEYFRIKFRDHPSMQPDGAATPIKPSARLRKREMLPAVMSSMGTSSVPVDASRAARRPGDDRLLIVSPVYREADHLDRAARSVAAQDRPPDRWIIVDDASDDATAEIARAWEKELPYLSVICLTRESTERDGLALARDARAFNIGLEAAGWRDYSHIGKIDGDIELPPHWFARLLEWLDSDPRLGIAGGRLEEPSPAGWRIIPIPDCHVHGAVKLYSRECLESIGGIPERLAWDAIDETYARMRGYSTLSAPDLIARHHRHWGSADGRLRGRARHGEGAWILHQSLPWALLRSVKTATVAPVGLSGLAFTYGYARAALRRVPRVDDPEFRRFVRSDLRARLRRRVPPRWPRGTRTSDGPYAAEPDRSGAGATRPAASEAAGPA